VSVVIGVDLGTGSARATAINRDGLVVGTEAAAYKGRADWQPGHADPEAWRSGVQRALELLAASVPEAATPLAIGVGGQSPGVVSSDGTDAITVLHPSAGVDDPHRAHLLMWDVLRADHPDASPLQAWDWILYSLGAPLQQGRWPETPMLEGFGPLHPTGVAVGEATGEWGVPKGTLLVPGGADAYMAFWAAGVDRPGRGLDPGGRTGGLGVATPAKGTAPSDYGLRSAVATVDILGGPVTAHGLAIEWWSRMTGQSVEALLEAAATVPAGSRGVLTLPYFEGERAPRWNRELRAEIAGLDTGADAATVMRSILEGCAFGIRHIVDALAADGVYMNEMVIAGTQARSHFFAQIKADVLGVPVEVPTSPDLAAYGAALAAGAAAGWWPIPGVGQSGDWPTGEHITLEPHPNPVYDEQYERWVALGDAQAALLATRAAAS